MDKLSFSNIAWDTQDDEIALEMLMRFGYSGIEIAPTKIFSANPYDKKEQATIYQKYILEQYSLVISSMQSIWFGKTENIFSNEESRSNLIEYTKKAIDLAQLLKCKNLVFGNPKNRNTYDSRDYNTALEFFKILGDYAQLKDTVIALEPNPSIYGTNFLNTTKEAYEFIKETNNAGIKLNLDIGTMLANREDFDILPEVINYVSHIHISEPYLENIIPRKLHCDVAEFLKEVAYPNFVSVEMKNPGSIERVIQTMEYVRGVFNEI